MNKQIVVTFDNVDGTKMFIDRQKMSQIPSIGHKVCHDDIEYIVVDICWVLDPTPSDLMRNEKECGAEVVITLKALW